MREDLLNLFKQYSNFAQPTSDWLGADTTIVISEASIQRTSANLPLLQFQEQPTKGLLDTGANISVISQKFFQIFTSKTQIIKITHTHKVTSASGANCQRVNWSLSSHIQVR